MPKAQDWIGLLNALAVYYKMSKKTPMDEAYCIVQLNGDRKQKTLTIHSTTT